MKSHMNRSEALQCELIQWQTSWTDDVTVLSGCKWEWMVRIASARWICQIWLNGQVLLFSVHVNSVYRWPAVLVHILCYTDEPIHEVHLVEAEDKPAVNPPFRRIVLLSIYRLGLRAVFLNGSQYFVNINSYKWDSYRLFVPKCSVKTTLSYSSWHCGRLPRRWSSNTTRGFYLFSPQSVINRWLSPSSSLLLRFFAVHSGDPTLVCAVLKLQHAALSLIMKE